MGQLCRGDQSVTLYTSHQSHPPELAADAVAKLVAVSRPVMPRWHGRDPLHPRRLDAASQLLGEEDVAELGDAVVVHLAKRVRARGHDVDLVPGARVALADIVVEIPIDLSTALTITATCGCLEADSENLIGPPALSEISFIPQFAAPTSKSPKPSSLSTMRASYVLLVAATSLLAASDAAISVASVQSTLSKVASPDAAQPIQVEQAAVSSTQRFLRSHKILEDDEEDVDSLDDEYEERGKAPFASKRLDKAMTSNSKLNALLKQWDDNNYSLQHVASNLGINLNGALDQKYMSLATSFVAYKNGWRPQ